MVRLSVSRIHFCLFVFLSCLMGDFLCQAQIGFQVSPAKLYFTQKGETEQTLRLHVNNTTNARLVLQATCVDWRRDSTGTKVYYAPGSLPTSVCSSIKVTPGVIELAPNEERDILVTLNPDQQVKSASFRNGMLLLTQSNEVETARSRAPAEFIIKVQMGVHLYVLPEVSLKPDIAITDMDISRSGEQYQVKVKVHNKGEILLESQLRLEYLNTETMEEVKVAPIPVNTLPTEAFNVTTTIPLAVTPGKYHIVAILDSGPNQALKVAELEAVLK